MVLSRSKIGWRATNSSIGADTCDSLGAFDMSAVGAGTNTPLARIRFYAGIRDRRQVRREARTWAKCAEWVRTSGESVSQRARWLWAGTHNSRTQRNPIPFDPTLGSKLLRENVRIECAS